MDIKVKKVYFCSHCNKHYLHKGFATRHEEFCSKNPKNHKPCYDCKYFDKKEIEVFADGGEYYNDRYIKTHCFHCSLKSLDFWTLSAQRKGLNQLYDNEMEFMPDSCEHFDDKWIFMNEQYEKLPWE
ncbi:hypothetical protein [uncultured Chryseobacterium sp.]|uniref:hypothetical protein n=1 Tax=uncultured Chryseobacterium sp. TaxID=259322 RepID=UPI0025841456|nr:hypothetical protein [uncultured Chryseobacterium sp.]